MDFSHSEKNKVRPRRLLSLGRDEFSGAPRHLAAGGATACKADVANFAALKRFFLAVTNQIVLTGSAFILT